MHRSNTAPLGVVHSRVVSRSPVYYGWVVLAVASVGLVMSSPGQTYAVSLFIEHFIADLGVSRSLVSTLYTGATLGGSFALPFVGRFVDRRGPRLMLALVAGAFGTACIYMGFVENALMLGLGFVAIRMFGQGSLVLVSNHMINQWWERRRGMMMGLSGIAMALLGLGAFPVVLGAMIPAFGWRMTYTMLGVLLLAGLAPLAYLLGRDRPEKYGLHPDGDDVNDPRSAAAQAAPDWTLPEARRTAAFWVTAVGISLIAMLSTGLFFHMVSILKDAGLNAAVAAKVFVPVALTTAVVNLGSGVLVDHVPLRLLLSAALGFMAAAMMMAPYLHTIELALAYGVLLGATSGLLRTVNAVGWAAYFGRTHLGSITGVTSTILIAGSALGPMPLGIARDVMGSYETALLVLAALPVAVGVASLFVRRPVK